jgi:pimeloyl-ACP methyl ester carboxylesterase
MVEDMMAVLDELGWESANLAGISMGGGLAQFAALLHPKRIRTLTVISAAESVRRRYPDPHARGRQLAAGRAAKLPPDGIARISQPVLAINGDEDPVVRPAAGQKIAETVPNGRFVLVHRMGHLFTRRYGPNLSARSTGTPSNPARWGAGRNPYPT